MNKVQIGQQIIYRIKQLTWPDLGGGDGGELMFRNADVIGSPLDPLGLLEVHYLPYCSFRILNSRPLSRDQQRQDELEANAEILIATKVPGDKNLQASLYGGGLEAGSLGHGLYHYEEEIWENLEILLQNDGITFSILGESASRAESLREIGNITYESLGLKVRFTRSRTYTIPTRLRATAPASLTWNTFVDRFDKKRFRLFRHTSKLETLAEAESSATELTLSDPFATSYVDSPSADSYFYHLFGIFNRRTTKGFVEESSEPRYLRLIVA